MPTARKFSVGDKVVVNYTTRGIYGKNAIIKGYDTYRKAYAVEIDGYSLGSDCGGRTKRGSGLWLMAQNLTKAIVPATVTPKESGCKFNVGDKVMFRYIDDLLTEWTLRKDGDTIEGPDMSENMNISCRKHLCGRTAIVEKITQVGKFYHLRLTSWSDTSGKLEWSYSDWMFRLVEKAKIVPKKKLTVAEVEKLLGYGVEVVKG